MFPPASTSSTEERIGRVYIGRLAAADAAEHALGVEEPTDREALLAILMSVQYAHVKLDWMLDIFGDDGEEEEDEADG